MENSTLQSLKANLQKQIEICKSSYEKVLKEVEKVMLLHETIEKFMVLHSKTNDYNFDLFDNIDLEELSKFKKNSDYTIQNIDYYKYLLEIKSELEKNNFGDRTKDIDDELNKLIENLNLFLSQYLKIYKTLILTKEKIKNELKSFEGQDKVIGKILNEELVTEEELTELEKLDIDKEKLLEIVLFAVRNNLKLMKENIELIQVQQSKKIIERKRKTNNKTQTFQKELSDEKVEELDTKTEELKPIKDIETISTSDLTISEKELIKTVKELIHSKTAVNNNKEFLQTLIGLSPEEILNYLDSYQNPEQKILIVLNDIIIPKIEKGEITNVKEILQLYLDKYNQLADRKKLPNRLASINKQYMQQVVEKAQGMLKSYESKTEVPRDLIGYYSILSENLADFLTVIEDDELFESTMLEEIYTQLEKSVVTIENLSKKILDTSKDLTLTEELYDGANNFLIFPGEINFSKQIDDDDALDIHSNKKIFNGLKQLSVEEDLFTSSRHKVKDTNPKYQKLRRYKGTDYRIVYRSSRALGLEKIFGKKMNVIFLINTGYGAKDGKERFYKKSKNIYDSVFDEIEKTIAILNSDNYGEIRKIVQKQMYKMQEFIDSCGFEYEKSSGRGPKGGNNNE